MITGAETRLYFQPGTAQVIGAAGGATLRPEMVLKPTRVVFPRGSHYAVVFLRPGTVRFRHPLVVRGADGKLYWRWGASTGVWEAAS